MKRSEAVKELLDSYRRLNGKGVDMELVRKTEKIIAFFEQDESMVMEKQNETLSRKALEIEQHQADSKSEIKAEFTEFNAENIWVKGKVGEYDFSAKLYDDVSAQYGINRGRVSKLCIWNEKKKYESDSFIANYDRGWDIKPKKEHIEYFDAVMKLLENAPKRY